MPCYNPMHMEPRNNAYAPLPIARVTVTPLYGDHFNFQSVSDAYAFLKDVRDVADQETALYAITIRVVFNEADSDETITSPDRNRCLAWLDRFIEPEHTII